MGARPKDFEDLYKALVDEDKQKHVDTLQDTLRIFDRWTNEYSQDDRDRVSGAIKGLIGRTVALNHAQLDALRMMLLDPRYEDISQFSGEDAEREMRRKRYHLLFHSPDKLRTLQEKALTFIRLDKTDGVTDAEILASLAEAAAGGDEGDFASLLSPYLSDAQRTKPESVRTFARLLAGDIAFRNIAPYRLGVDGW